MRGPSLCPRCGQPGYGPYVQRKGSNEYLVFIHVEGRHRRACYLGAKDRYEYFNVVEDLGLRGLGDPMRHVDYVRSSIVGAISEASRMISEGRLDDARRLLDGLRRALDEAYLKLRNVEEALKAIGPMRPPSASSSSSESID